MNDPFQFFSFCYWIWFFFFFFLSSLFAPSSCFHCSVCEAKEITTIKKRWARANFKINLKMHHAQVSFIWIKELRNKVWQRRAVELVEFGCYNQISVFYRVRPPNSRGFTVCHTVLLPCSRCHGRFFIRHGFTLRIFNGFSFKLTIF